MVATIMTYNREQHCAIVIPHYNTLDSLWRLIEKIPPSMLPQTLVIDDGSITPPTGLPCPMIRHQQNKGYGAAQQSGYLHFLHTEGFEQIQQIAMVHGDNQYDFHAIWQAALELHNVQLGSRHLVPSIEERYPWWRKWGNHALTGIANATFKTQHTDLHTGARLYSRQFLGQLPWERLSTDFVFDQQVLCFALQHQIPMIEFPIAANYQDDVSSISFRRSITYGLGCLQSLWAAKRARF